MAPLTPPAGPRRPTSTGRLRRDWNAVRASSSDAPPRTAGAQRVAKHRRQTSGSVPAGAGANALVFGYFGALGNSRYLTVASTRSATYVEEGLLPLRSIWSKPDGSGSP